MRDLFSITGQPARKSVIEITMLARSDVRTPG